MMDIMVIQIIPKGIDSAPHVAILFLPQNFLVPAVIKHLGENHDDWYSIPIQMPFLSRHGGKKSCLGNSPIGWRKNTIH